jgi:hypothetical protein
MSSTSTSFAPVWFSTDRQLEALAHSFESATMTSKLLGRFEIPEDVAFIQHVIMAWTRVPLALQAQGTVSLNDVSFSFRPTPYRVFGFRVSSPLQGLRFDLAPSDVTIVEPADFCSPVARTFDVPFTRIRTSRPGPLDNFLLCVGGRVAMPRIRSQSHDLRQRLLSWHEASIRGGTR